MVFWKKTTVVLQV